MPRTDVSFKTHDGVTLRGWFFTPSAPISNGKSLPCLIITHGISCVKEMGLAEVAERFVADLSITCLVYDHRGFGSSDTGPGQPRLEVITWLQSNDMRDAITYAQSREGVDKDKIALWGYSLGAGEAVYVAAMDRRVKAVVALGPGLSGLEIVKRQAPPFAVNAMQPLFEADRLARAKGEAPLTVPMVTDQPGGQSVLPSPESWAFFSQWIREDSPWKNALTVRRSVFRLRSPVSRSDANNKPAWMMSQPTLSQCPIWIHSRQLPSSLASLREIPTARRI
jgi:pimeloyl-ACP methyl ester carboxylesterase